MIETLVRSLLHHVNGTVVVAVVAVGMVQATVPILINNEVVDVIAVGDGFVTATRSADMIGRVRTALGRTTTIGVRIADRDAVLEDLAILLVMEVTIMDVVDVVAVPDAGVAAAGTVLVRMIALVCGL